MTHNLFKERVTEEELIEILSETTYAENNAMAFILRQVDNGHTLKRLRDLVDQEFYGKEMDRVEEGLIEISLREAGLKRRDPEICTLCQHHEKDCHCTAYGYR